MKENVINILMYLLQSAPIDEEAPQRDHETIRALLADAGFDSNEIHAAFRWLDELDTQISSQALISPADQSSRCFSEAEKVLLDTNCQNYLLGLTNAGILTPHSFELLIDRLFALGISTVDLDQLEWIVLIVLSNQSDQQTAFRRLEAMTYHEPNILLN